jgi:hypothetical protein
LHDENAGSPVARSERVDPRPSAEFDRVQLAIRSTSSRQTSSRRRSQSCVVRVEASHDRLGRVGARKTRAMTVAKIAAIPVYALRSSVTTRRESGGSSACKKAVNNRVNRRWPPSVIRRDNRWKTEGEPSDKMTWGRLIERLLTTIVSSYRRPVSSHRRHERRQAWIPVCAGMTSEA